MTVSDQIIEVLNALCEKFGIALDWGNENVIPYIYTLFEKFINYEIWSSVATLVLAIVAGIVFIILIRKPKVRDFIWNAELYGVCAFFGLMLLGIFSITVIVIETGDIIKCVTFPELYIFEYIKQLIESGS